MEQDLAEKLRNYVLSAEEKQEITLNEDDVSESTEECLRSLFGRIYGSKKANFTGLHNFLEKTWQPKENFEMKEVGYNCFQFIFSSKSDMEHILEKRVNWSFENQYLLLKEWSEDTIDKIETMDKVGMWVQLWNIPFHWLSVRTGRKIARVFPAIHDVVVPETGRFIKIRVDVSLDKPLIRGTTISMGEKSRWVDFKYENLLGFCTYCGRVGHSLRSCEVRINDLAQNNLQQQGQFGEWIRAPENDPKTNCQHSRGRGNNWKSEKESYEGVPETSGISKGEEAVAEVRYEVNKLTQQVSTMQDLVGREIKVDDKELVVLAEMLMKQLLRLNSIEAEGEGRARRRAEVRRETSLMADEVTPEVPLVLEPEPAADPMPVEEDPENDSSKRAREEVEEQKGNGEKKAKVEDEKPVEEQGLESSGDAKMEEDRNEMEGVAVGPKTFGSSVEIFDYFHKLLHAWPANLNLNKYEHILLLDLLKKGHSDFERKIGKGVKAFQVRNHPRYKSRCFFLTREDESVDDFSFRKCVDHILPLPENMQVRNGVNKALRGKGGGRGRGRGRGGR